MARVTLTERVAELERLVAEQQQQIDNLRRERRSVGEVMKSIEDLLLAKHNPGIPQRPKLTLVSSRT